MDICLGIVPPPKEKEKENVMKVRAVMAKVIMEKGIMEKGIMEKDLIAKGSIRDMTQRDLAKESSKGVKGKAKDFRGRVGLVARMDTRQTTVVG